MIFIQNKIIISSLFWCHYFLNMLPWLCDYQRKSTIDWCENNYVIVPCVAEFYNSISMIPGILLLVYKYQNLTKHAKNMYSIIAYFLAIWLSVGSFMFHATLNRFWQAQDELPMLYLGIWTFFCTLKLYKSEINYSVIWFVFICTFITRIYTLSTDYLHFIIPYILITFTSLSSLLYHIIYLSYNSKTKILGLTGIISISVGFIFWLIDVFYCTDIKLHSIWHLCIGITKYCLIEYLTLSIDYNRQIELRKNI